MKRTTMSHGVARGWRPACAAAIAALLLAQHGAAASGHTCQRVAIEGESGVGREWKTELGQGWVFRVVPIGPSKAGYTGWDLVVDREPPAGFPDALLLATIPYDSINEREIGTTFGLRAQDAIGWNPRSVRFLTDSRDFREAQSIYLSLFGGSKDSTAPRRSAAMARLLELEKRASPGELRILDARIVPGVADPKPYAQSWALAASRTQHEVQPASPGQASAQGKLVWMRFSLTLWLPAAWRPPAALHPARVPCPD